MLKNKCCYLCLTNNKRTINIYKTDLQYIYENLADLKIRDMECWMCYICHTRLRQCHRLRQLALQTRGLIDDLCEKKINTFGTFGTLLELSIHNETMISVPVPSSYIKQEPDVKMEPIDNDGFDQGEIQEYANNEAKNTMFFIEFEDPMLVSDAGCTQTLLNVDRNDGWQESKGLELKLDGLSQSNIDTDVQQSLITHTVTENHFEDWGEHTAAMRTYTYEQSTESTEIKQEIEEKLGDTGINQDDQQENTNDYEGRDRASEAQSGCYKKPFSCDVCSRTFSCKSQLLRHIRTHTGDKPYSCNICLKKFAQKNNLNQHILIHNGHKPFSCNICSKKFSQKCNLKTHIRSHRDDKPFSCNVCEKNFAHKSTLNNHILTHSGDKPFSCEICSKQFALKKLLKAHMRIHTDDKQFSCSICQKKFLKRLYMNRHMRIHSGEKPYSCNVCQKKFAHKRSLNDHIVIHTRDKPFECNICSKKFSLKSTLKTHLLIHLGNKPFSCNICGNKFRQNRQLNYHMKSHTGEPGQVTIA